MKFLIKSTRRRRRHFSLFHFSTWFILNYLNQSSLAVVGLIDFLMSSSIIEFFIIIPTSRYNIE